MENRKKLKLTYAIIVVTIVALLATLTLDLPMYTGLLTGFVFAAAIAFHMGFKLTEISKMTYEGIKKSIIVLFLMSLIGMLIGMWMGGGTVPAMIYYGLIYLTNSNIILAAFISCTIVSSIMGTAFGTVSTIGTVFISLAIGLNIPLAPLTGAIVSGSFFGDRTSPLSGSLNMTSQLTQTRVLDNIKHMNFTTIPTYALCLLLYWFTGRSYTGNFSGSSEVIYLQNLLNSSFNIDFILLISPIIILLCALVIKLPTLKSISTGLAASIIIYMTKNSGSAVDAMDFLINGFHPANSEISKLIAGGGLISMINIILLILASSGLIGILEGTNVIDPLINNFTKKIKNARDLIHKTSLLCISITTITCNQSLAIIISGHYLKTIYDDFNLSRNTLARTISDVGVVIVPLIPWNVNALFVVSITGVSTLEYLPYAFLCYIPVVMTFIYPFFIKNRANKSAKKENSKSLK